MYCEAGEVPRVIARKAVEGIGLQVEVDQLVEAYSFEDDTECDGLLLVYEARISSGELQRDRTSYGTAGFFTSAEIPEPLCDSGHNQAIGSWRNQAQLEWQPGSPMHFCPHCSRPLVERVAFGRLRLVCLACGFVDLRGPKVGVSLLITDDEDKLLLVRRAIEPGKGKWCLPSGYVDWDESPEDAAVRECGEETGLVVTAVRLIEVGHYTDDFRGPGINLTYQARVADGCLQPGDDAEEARYFAPTELPAAEDVAFASHRAVVERLRGSQAGSGLTVP
jgi:8-oxo-dGTP diphosphatase